MSVIKHIGLNTCQGYTAQPSISFQDYDEIETKNTRETKSELLRLLQDTRVPLSPYLVNALCNDPVFFNALLRGVDMMSVSGEEACLALLDVLIVISKSKTVKKFTGF